ncbi:serine/threonine protein kinase [Pseudomonas izuensis]|uniref:Serine/threonine protein kinase n=2 Tax=Pseudomonas TaxID=286 RepID=A0ABM7RJZ4_9PSED|nr:serine/threonine protein kinase [Pseudomonas izuensis]
MPLFFPQGLLTMQCSRLPQAALNQMINGARVLEADSYGPKVYLLQDGNILKLFRRKRFFSSALVRPYSKRFIDNAVELQKLGVPTLQVLQFYRLQAPGMTAVLYQPLPGETLRQIANKEGFSWPQALPDLANLIRNLHDSGIYFRSLHLGNIVITPDNRMGLIDVADMRFLRAPLPRHLVKRNLQHFARYIARENLNETFPMQALEQAVLPS